MISREQITQDFRSKEFRDFLDNQRLGPEEPPHYMMSLYARRLVYAEAAALEVYHALVWLFEDYPTLKSVKPLWIPDIDRDDNSFILRFRLEMATEDAPDEELYQYDQPPASFADHATFDLAIETGEFIGPEIWNEMASFCLVSRKDPYQSIQEVEADMQEDLGEFLTQAAQWALSRATPPAPSSKSGPRL